MTKTLSGEVNEDLEKRRRLFGRIWMLEAEPEWVVADWVVPQEAPAQTGPVFKCTTHLHGRCKPAICEEHREWERKNRFKIGGHAGGWGSRRGNPRAGECGSASLGRTTR